MNGIAERCELRELILNFDLPTERRFGGDFLEPEPVIDFAALNALDTLRFEVNQVNYRNFFKSL